jgi:hypothetical protein
MPPVSVRSNAKATIELRAAAIKVARSLPDGRPRWFILRLVGEQIEVLEGGSETAVCAGCRRHFTYDPAYFTAQKLHAPRSCFACRILKREADRAACRVGTERR